MATVNPTDVSGTGDIVIQAQDTGWVRLGFQTQRRFLLTPFDLSSYVLAAVTSTPMATDYVQNTYANLYGLASQDEKVIGGGKTLFDIQSLKLTDLPGAAALANIYGILPFGNDYETQTLALYTRSFTIAKALARSGPVNVRGGTARAGFEQAELDAQFSINRFKEIWQNQLTMAGLVISAASTAGQSQASLRNDWLRSQQQQAASEQGKAQQKLEAAKQLDEDRNQHLKALSLYSDTVCQPCMLTNEDYTGKGFQHGVNTGHGFAIQR